MRENFKPIAFGEILFVIALAVFLLGSGLLLITTGIVDRGSAVLPLCLSAAGIILAYMTGTRRLGAKVHFLGVTLAIVGLELVIMNALHWTLLMTWPLFMLAIGIAILSSGLRNYRKIKAMYLVPACIFILLSVLFSFFSFKIIRIPLKHVVQAWWPLVFVIVGASLFGLYAYNKARFSERPHPGRRR